MISTFLEEYFATQGSLDESRMENVSSEIPRLVFCQELDEKIDTTLMSVRKYMTGTSSYLA